MKIKCTNHKLRHWFTSGKEYKAWVDNEGDTWSDSDMGLSVRHGTLSLSVYGEFEMVEDQKPHPHADLMLKYAMIAQYDDKPWCSFEVFSDGEWIDCEHEGLYAGIEYRLKPQEPKIQLGQIWVSKEEGVSVVIDPPSSSEIIHFSFTVGGLKFTERLPVSGFLLLFKLKDNK